MNRDFLNSLIGLNIQQAEEKVRQAGHMVDSIPVNPSIDWLYNLVELYYDKNGKVVNSLCQKVTDQERQ